VNHPMALFANAGVDAEVTIALYSRAPDDEAVLILFGKEQVTLEFYDVASLERLRDVAAEGARRLRAVIEANIRAGAAEEAAADGAVAAADRPVELDADVLPVQGAEAAEGGQDAAELVNVGEVAS
jgi:hypothetical protein